MNKIVRILFYIFLAGNILDFFSTFLVGKAESNPIVARTGILGLLLIKVFLILIFYWIARTNVYKSDFQYYITISIMVYATFMLVFAGVVNLTIVKTTPEYIEAASELPQIEKTGSYLEFIKYFYIFPMLFNILIFKLWEKSRKEATIQCRIN